MASLAPTVSKPIASGPVQKPDVSFAAPAVDLRAESFSFSFTSTVASPNINPLNVETNHERQNSATSTSTADKIVTKAVSEAKEAYQRSATSSTTYTVTSNDVAKTATQVVSDMTGGLAGNLGAVTEMDVKQQAWVKASALSNIATEEAKEQTAKTFALSSQNEIANPLNTLMFEADAAKEKTVAVGKTVSLAKKNAIKATDEQKLANADVEAETEGQNSVFAQRLPQNLKEELSPQARELMAKNSGAKESQLQLPKGNRDLLQRVFSGMSIAEKDASLAIGE